MYYLSTEENYYLEAEDFKGVVIHNRKNPFSCYHEMNFPFYLGIMNCDPLNGDAPFIWSAFAPDFYSYSVYSAADLRQLSDHSMFHHHNYYEAFFVLDGTMTQKLDDDKFVYPKGSGALINRNIRHGELITTNFRTVFLGFSLDFSSQLSLHPGRGLFKSDKTTSHNCILEFFNKNSLLKNAHQQDYLDFMPSLNSNDQSNILHTLFEKMIHVFLYTNSYPTLQLELLLYELFHILQNPHYYHSTHMQLGANSETLLFLKISSLLEDSDGRMSRKHLETHLNYNGNHLNNTVKKFTGMTLSEYGASFTLKKAEQLLINSNKPISEICQELQFSNRTHFYKLFHEQYGMTPKEYRAQNASL